MISSTEPCWNQYGTSQSEYYSRFSRISTSRSPSAIAAFNVSRLMPAQLLSLHEPLEILQWHSAPPRFQPGIAWDRT